jgi:quinol monooxygenase YgiN
VQRHTPFAVKYSGFLPSTFPVFHFILCPSYFILFFQMFGGLKIIQVKPGQEAAFERLFAGLRTEMRAREPGCHLYTLLKSRKRPGAYIVQEQYTGEAAWQAHESSPHGAIYFPQLRALLEKITTEYFNGVVK